MCVPKSKLIMPDNFRIPAAGDAFSVLAVIVLYKIPPEESRTFKTFMASYQKLDPDRSLVGVLLYDNTPEPGIPGALPPNVRYEAAGKNAGLAAAYNRALDIAQERGFSWLLLLDQDSVLPPDFLELLRSEGRKYAANDEVAAIVPIVCSGDVVISPRQVGFFGLKPFSHAPRGIQDAEMMAINSGTAVRCDFVRSIGGFNRAYWLDYLDHWLFRQIYKSGKKAAVLPCCVEHSLSVQDYRRNISPARYRSILGGESAFMTSHKPKLQIPFYLLRLAARSIRMTLRRQPDLALLTLATMVKVAAHPGRSLEQASR